MLLPAGRMTDGEIRAELKTAEGNRRGELVLEMEERRRYRASWKPSGNGLLPVGRPGAHRPYPAEKEAGNG
jgi:hypothetical protein